MWKSNHTFNSQRLHLRRAVTISEARVDIKAGGFWARGVMLTPSVTRTSQHLKYSRKKTIRRNSTSGGCQMQRRVHSHLQCLELMGEWEISVSIRQLRRTLSHMAHNANLFQSFKIGTSLHERLTKGLFTARQNTPQTAKFKFTLYFNNGGVFQSFFSILFRFYLGSISLGLITVP